MADSAQIMGLNVCKGQFTRSKFWSQLLLTFKEVSDANQRFYELKQCQKKNWIQRIDLINAGENSLTFGTGEGGGGGGGAHDKQ